MYLPSIFEENFMDDIFNDFFSGSSKSRKPSDNSSAYLMHTDIKEFEDKYELSVELPGYKKEDIQAELKDGYLTISANHEETSEETDKKGKLLHRERYTGKCVRSFFVGKDVTEKDISAGFSDGILKLELPKIDKKAAIEDKKLIAIQ